MSNLPQHLTAPLEIRLVLKPAGSASVHLPHGATVGVGRSFSGLDPREWLENLPRIFAICAHAQTAACRAALAAADGQTPAPERLRRHELAVMTESLFETTRALTLTGPGYLEIPPPSGIEKLVDSAHRLYDALAWEGIDTAVADAARDFADLCAGLVFGAENRPITSVEELLAWSVRDASPTARLFMSVLENGWAEMGHDPAVTLDDHAPSEILEPLTGAEGRTFSMLPSLDGKRPETGAFARLHTDPLIAALIDRHGPGLLARLTGRLLESARLIARLHDAPSGFTDAAPVVRSLALDNGWGAGLVHSARGLLCHAVRMEENRIDELRILPPTAWNFGSGGPAFRALEHLGGRAGFRRGTRRAALAALVAGVYDPCVPCRIQVIEKEDADA